MTEPITTIHSKNLEEALNSVNKITTMIVDMRKVEMYPGYIKKSIDIAHKRCNELSEILFDVDNDIDEFIENGDTAFTEELEGHILTEPNQVRFIRDMIANGYEDRLRYYNGRNYYKGAAVTTSYDDGISEDDIVRDTSVSLQRDNMGKYDMILYPR